MPALMAPGLVHLTPTGRDGNRFTLEFVATKSRILTHRTAMPDYAGLLGESDNLTAGPLMKRAGQRHSVTQLMQCLASLTLFLCVGAAQAGPWTGVGDAELRSDIEILADAGVIDNITMQWPLPWGGILARLEQPDALDGQPEYVRAAARRVEARGDAETATHTLRAGFTADGTGAPALVRGFDALGRQTMQGQATLEYLTDSTAVHLAVGAESVNKKDHQVFVPDGSYIAQRIGNAAIYAGYVDHWWGPGWISAMSLSTNARPVPQVGISRISTTPFDSPLLSWIGPWQMEFFVGVLDGPRIARNTIYDGFRFAFSPIPHLEIGLSRTDQMCGTGHPCKPLKGYFSLTNQTGAANIVNDEGSIDIRYSGSFSSWAYETYAQFMNEDTNPLTHSGTSHLFGASVWRPFRGGVARLTFEFADSHATKDLWGSGIFYGVAYNNYQYVDGMRYRDRTLGFGLDSDSTLYSLQANVMDNAYRSFTLTYHHALVADAHSPGANVLSSAPVTINIVEGRLTIPHVFGQSRVKISFDGRLQDDQPRPQKGFLATGEIALSVSL